METTKISKLVLGTPSKSEPVFDALYLSHLSPFDHPTVREENELLRTYMTPQKGDIVLDVGCGKGRVEKLFPNADVISTDITDDVQPFIERTFIKASMTDLPFPDNHFDKIFCLNTIAHFKRQQKGIDEAYRVLKPGGKMVVTTPNKLYVRCTRLAGKIGLIPPLFFDNTARWLLSRLDILDLFSMFGTEIHYYQKRPKFCPNWLRPKFIIIAEKPKKFVEGTERWA